MPSCVQEKFQINLPNINLGNKGTGINGPSQQSSNLSLLDFLLDI